MGLSSAPFPAAGVHNKECHPRRHTDADQHDQNIFPVDEQDKSAVRVKNIIRGVRLLPGAAKEQAAA